MGITIEKLQRFCDTDAVRYMLGKPWIDGDYVVACDGRHIIQIEKRECEFNVEPMLTGSKYPRVADVMAPIGQVKAWVSLEAGETCPVCGDKTGRFNRCKACDGAGEIECCDHCDYSGECFKCKGVGKREFNCQCYVELCGVSVDRRFVHHFLDIGPPRDLECGTADDKLFIRSAAHGFTGCIMRLAINDSLRFGVKWQRCRTASEFMTKT